MTEVILCLLATINTFLCAFHKATWFTGMIYWAVLAGMWFDRRESQMEIRAAVDKLFEDEKKDSGKNE